MRVAKNTDNVRAENQDKSNEQDRNGAVFVNKDVGSTGDNEELPAGPRDQIHQRFRDIQSRDTDKVQTKESMEINKQDLLKSREHESTDTPPAADKSVCPSYKQFSFLVICCILAAVVLAIITLLKVGVKQSGAIFCVCMLVTMFLKP